MHMHELYWYIDRYMSIFQATELCDLDQDHGLCGLRQADRDMCGIGQENHEMYDVGQVGHYMCDIM